jgi:DNA repair protein RadC
MILQENKVRYSADTYNNAQLLGIIIGGTNGEEKAKALLTANDNHLLGISRMDFTALRKYLTEVEAKRVFAAFNLKKRLDIEIYEPVTIRSSYDIHDAIKSLLEDLYYEEFWVIYLNRANKIIEKVKISQGGICGTVTDVKIILKKGIELLSSGIILCHNHPSGNTTPSEQDINLTQKIKKAGLLMDINVLDHIIISGTRYYSFADNGEL